VAKHNFILKNIPAYLPNYLSAGVFGLFFYLKNRRKFKVFLKLKKYISYFETQFKIEQFLVR